MSSNTTKLVNSASFLIGGKLLQRLIGLVSIVILARILAPGDFAVAAVIAMVIYFFDVLSNVGNEQYIVQKAHVSPQDLNTAWSLSLCIKGALTLLLFALIPLIDNYYENMQLTAVLMAATCVLPIRALSNPGIFELQRNLEYKPIFVLTLFQRLASFIAVMLMVYIEPSYWALVIADLIAALTYTLGSYSVHGFRPKFSLRNGSEQWVFSRWLLAKNIVGYTRSQVDTFLVSSFYASRDLGRYYLSRDIVMLPSQNLLTPAIQPLLATFSRVQQQGTSFSQQLNLALCVTTLLTVPIVIYIWQFPAPLIDTILGEKWSDSYPLLSAMSLLVLYIPFLLLFEQALFALGLFKQVFAFDLASLGLIIGGLMLLPTSDLVEFAALRGGLGIIATLLLMVYLRIKLNFSLSTWLVWLLATATLAVIAANIAQLFVGFADNFAFLQLLTTGTIFTATYTLLLGATVLKLAPYNAQCHFIQILVLERISALKKKVKSKPNEK